MKIILDAMGGDKAPDAVVFGAIKALKENSGLKIVLVGRETEINDILKKEKGDLSGISIINATQVIENDDNPVKSLKAKTDSSMVVSMKMLKEDPNSVMISAGNTGALMVGGILLIGKIEGVDRPAITALIPAKNRPVLLLDAGANTMCKPDNYLEFAFMGANYARRVMKRANPKVYLLNIGTEETKGSETVKNAYKLLKNECEFFCGNIEGRDIVSDMADVIVCDGFTGNVALKSAEGTALFMTGLVKNIFSGPVSKISALLVKSKIDQMKKKLDYEEYGGAPLLGIKGKIIKCHGSSSAEAIKNAILKFAIPYGESSVIEDLTKDMKDVQEKRLENDI